jgi:hypothetical protein
MTNLDIAIAWIERGRRVFPCWNTPGAPGHKAPMGNLVPKGVLNATDDADVVCEWWSVYPDALVGVAGGDGLVLVDLDDKTPDRGTGTEAWLALGGSLDGANVVKTKSGGYHLYFTGDLPNSKDTIAGGLEVRCRNQYVIAWDVVEQWPAPPLPAFLQKKVAESKQASYARRSQRVLSTRYDLVGAFEAEGLYLGEVGREGKHAVTCPWHEEHDNNRVYKADATVIFEPDDEGKPWGFKCSRSSCSGRTVRDVIKKLANLHPEFFTDGVLKAAQFTSDGHDYTFNDGLVEINASRLVWRGDDLFAEIVVKDTDRGELAPTIVTMTRISSRNDLVRTPVSSHPTWSDVWNDFCRQVIEAERGASVDSVDLRSVERPTADPEYVAHALLPGLPRSSMSIWFGDGGSGKSLVALFVAGQLAKQGLRVLYLDFEMGAGDHRGRFEQLFGDDMPELFYMSCDTPLPLVADSIKRKIRREKIDFVVVDSIVFAAGGPAEESDIAQRYCQLARQFGVGSLHLAHITKGGDNATEKPFGSSFWHNGARSTWYVKQDDIRREKTETIIDLSLYHKKTNFGPREKEPRGVRIIHKYAEDRITFMGWECPVTVASTPALMKQTIETRGPMDRETLKSAMVEAGVKIKTFTKTLNREIKTGTLYEEDGLIFLKD